MSPSSSSNTSIFSIISWIVVLVICSCITIIDAIHWDHAVDLNEDFRVLWTIMNQDITFEVQARTLGYVGFGFSRDGSLIGSDVVVGWVDRGQAHFQDRHVKLNGDGEPVVDPSQDYILMLGYENATHTVLRFRRKLDTCDTAHDIPITNDTMKVIYMYHEDEPRQGSVVPGTLPNPLAAVRKYQPLLLTQKLEMRPLRDEHVRILELRNEGVELPIGDEHMWWCKVFKLEDIHRKHYLIRYEPIIESTASLQHLQHIMLYECDGGWPVLEKLSKERGRYCSNHEIIELVCYSFVATWTRGSKGFTFPDDVGYPMNSKQTKYYLMETYFYNPKPEYTKSYIKQKDADSGLKLYITQSARKHDAGVLTIGMQPNWAHIIPPEQKRVVSEGHCIEDCTGYAFPSQGINIFAVLMLTHSLGKEVKLRQIRRNEELPPIVHDKNFDPSYMDYRKLPTPVRSMPGDRLIAECIYDSTSRFTMTLGGTAMYQETCIIQTLYYPRQKDLTSCQSSPSLATVLHSLGIEELAVDSNPVLISSPSELAGMTFESRLSSYDWKNQFEKFQEITRRGPFKPLCLGADNYVVPGTDNVVGYSVNVSKTYHEPSRCKPKRLFATEMIPEIEFPVIEDEDSNNIIEGAARSKVSRSSATETMSLSGVRGLFNSKRNLINSFWYTSIVILLQMIFKSLS